MMGANTWLRSKWGRAIGLRAPPRARLPGPKLCRRCRVYACARCATHTAIPSETPRSAARASSCIMIHDAARRDSAGFHPTFQSPPASPSSGASRACIILWRCPLASDGIAGAALSLVVSPYALIQKRHHPARTRSSGRGCARNTTPHACAHCGLGRAFAGAFRLPSESDSFAGFRRSV